MLLVWSFLPSIGSRKFFRLKCFYNFFFSGEEGREERLKESFEQKPIYLGWPFCVIKWCFFFFVLVLTSSIEKKIKQFAKVHPEASKQANLASALLPQLPLSDEKYKIAKREITRRAAEFDSLEDTFSHKEKTTTSGIPEILKEHFRRNSEASLDDQAERSKRNLNDEGSLMEKSKDEAFEALFHWKNENIP